MSRIGLILPFEQPPEDVDLALRIPIPEQLVSEIYYPGLALDYERLSSEGQIQPKTRLTFTPKKAAGSLISNFLGDSLPEDISLKVVGENPDGKTPENDDSIYYVFDERQPIAGFMRLRLDKGLQNRGKLIINGKLDINETTKDAWPEWLGDIEQSAIHYGVKQPAKRLLEHVPDIIKSAARR